MACGCTYVILTRCTRIRVHQFRAEPSFTARHKMQLGSREMKQLGSRKSIGALVNCCCQVCPASASGLLLKMCVILTGLQLGKINFLNVFGNAVYLFTACGRIKELDPVATENKLGNQKNAQNVRLHSRLHNQAEDLRVGSFCSI
jgi:hypothetical protein